MQCGKGERQVQGNSEEREVGCLWLEPPLFTPGWAAPDNHRGDVKPSPVRRRAHTSAGQNPG